MKQIKFKVNDKSIKFTDFTNGKKLKKEMIESLIEGCIERIHLDETGFGIHTQSTGNCIVIAIFCKFNPTSLIVCDNGYKIWEIEDDENEAETLREMLIESYVKDK